MTSSPHGPYGLGYTRATIGPTEVATQQCGANLKKHLSSDCSLQLESMKVESLVIADQHAAVNTFPGLVHTARHTMGVGLTRSWCANLLGGSQPRSGQRLGWSRNKVAVGELRLDHLLSKEYPDFDGKIYAGVTVTAGISRFSPIWIAILDKGLNTCWNSYVDSFWDRRLDKIIGEPQRLNNPSTITQECVFVSLSKKISNLKIWNLISHRPLIGLALTIWACSSALVRAHPW